MSRAFIGFGTGRCGTQSLARILSSCRDTYAVHEKYLVDWYNPNPLTIENLVGFLISGPANQLRGAVALTHIRILEQLNYRIKDLKLIHIWRNREEVAESFNRVHTGISRVLERDYSLAMKSATPHINANHLSSLAGTPHIFPKLEAENSYDSYLKYWDHYMELVKNLDLNFYIININDLNDNKELDKLYDYLEIFKKNRVYPQRRRFNAI